tara:strand:- start:1341 stop:1484 length:144 start_codon:yes stop_codon:yes gene_type:complete
MMLDQRFFKVAASAAAFLVWAAGLAEDSSEVLMTVLMESDAKFTDKI